jgi:hypothetical protein
MKRILLTLLALFLIFEEWLWDVLTAFGRSLIQWLKLGAAEQWLSQSSPNRALLTFSIPVLIVMPISIMALVMLANGLIVQGILLEIAAKLLATVLLARVFELTKPQLLSFSFLNLLYSTILRWLEWAHHKIVQTPIYHNLKRFETEARAKFSAWLR